MTRIPRLVAHLLGAACLVGACGNPTAQRANTTAGQAASLAPTATTTGTSTSPSPTEPLAVGLKGRIIFTRAHGPFGDDTVFITNADGTNERQLTTGSEGCCPRISPDGTAVLYSATAPDGNRITTAIQDLASGKVRLVPLPTGTLNLGPGAWSPDGSRLALQGWDDADHAHDGIYSVRSNDGKDLRRLTGPIASAIVPAEYLPDGQHLVVFEQTGENRGDLVMLDLASGEVRPLTVHGNPVGNAWARSSPDGTRILFQESRVSATGWLFTIRPDGTDLTRVFADSKGRFASHPTWSPDGSQLLFALNTYASRELPNELYVANADGSDLRLVLGGNDYKREPEWRIP